MPSSRNANLDAQLIQAAWEGDPERLNQLLSLGADPGAEDFGALNVAARTGNFVCASLLLPGNAQKVMDLMALACAAESGSIACLNLILPFSDLPTSGPKAIAAAARGGHVECLSRLLSLCAPEDGVPSALSEAAVHGHLECVKLLIPVSRPLLKDAHPLMAAIMHGHSDVVSHIFSLDSHFSEFLNIEACLERSELQGHDRLRDLFISVLETRALRDTVAPLMPSAERSLRL